MEHFVASIDLNDFVLAAVVAAVALLGWIRGRRDHARLRASEAKLQELVRLLQRQQAIIQSQAVHDPLTGLHNRLALDDAFSRELIRARRSGHPIGVIMADLDRFKRVNDAHGHHAGDRVLQAFAAILQSHARASDVCCRFGGEEFVIVMPDASKAQAAARAEVIRKALAATQISIDPGVLRVTASFGVAAYPDDGVGAEELINAADVAMYAAKAAGRNRVVEAQRERRETLVR